MRFVWKVTPVVAALLPAAARAHGSEPSVVSVAPMLIPITMFLSTAAVIIVAILMANRTARLRQETIQLAIKEGRELPPELFIGTRHPRRRRDPLLGGLVLSALGVAVSISVGAVCGAVQAVWGLIPLFVGVALLIYVPFWRKQKKEEEDR